MINPSFVGRRFRFEPSDGKSKYAGRVGVAVEEIKSIDPPDPAVRLQFSPKEKVNAQLSECVPFSDATVK